MTLVFSLGGEASGHIICLDKSTTGDGILAALEVLDTMLDNRRTLHQLVADLDIYPQRMINVPVGGANGKGLVGHERVAAAVKQAQSELGETGRVVLRPSGTEPVVRVMIEGDDPGRVEKLAREVAATVESAAACAA